jgi:hypothetical protein
MTKEGDKIRKSLKSGEKYDEDLRKRLASSKPKRKRKA